MPVIAGSKGVKPPVPIEQAVVAGSKGIKPPRPKEDKPYKGKDIGRTL